jgi:hypothetical protein
MSLQELSSVEPPGLEPLNAAVESEVEEEDVESKEPIVDPFDPSKIKVDREPMPIFQAMRKVAFNEIKLDPDFQRNFVWDQTRQSRLIESILLKIPLPAFYLDAVQPDQWVVVDGLQRLFTLERFCNKKELKLKGLEFLSRQFEGMTFDELPRSSQRDIEETQLMMYIIRPETPPKVKFTIFHRINTGGVVLSAQEIRHATFPGRAPVLLKDLATRGIFLRATGFSVSPTRMDDRECVLRHLAFRITDYQRYNKPDLNDFLGSAMNYLNSVSTEMIDQLAIGFAEAMEICDEVFGRLAFRKFNLRTGYRGPINKALFESWSTVVLDYDRQSLVANKAAIVEGLDRAWNTDNDYVKSLSLATGGINAVKKRFSKANQIIQQVTS